MLTGELGAPFDARSEPIRVALVPNLGGDPPYAPSLPAEHDGPGLKPLRGDTSGMNARAAATAAIEAFFANDLERLRTLLADMVWVVWPIGAIGHHSSDEMIDLIEQRRAPARTVSLERIRDDDSASLRARFPRGIARPFEELFALRSGRLVSADLSFDGEWAGRVMILVRPRGRRRDQGWVAGSLPLPAFDHAVVASKWTRSDYDATAAAGERVVRSLLLGANPRLEADRSFVHSRLWLGEDLIERDQLIAAAASGEHRLEMMDTVFNGTRRRDFSQLKKLIHPRLAERVQESAATLFRQSIRELDAQVTVTELARLDARTMQSTAVGQAVCWVVHPTDEAGRARPVVAGVFL
jgi:hypothetical protein